MVRISDIIVSEWNGDPDSARSMESEDLDLVLMANGTDRYSGTVEGIGGDGTVSFAGRFGSFQLPLDQVAEIRFAASRLAAPGEASSDSMVVRLGPLGAVTGRPLAGDASRVDLLSPVLGRIRLSLEPATMILFNTSSQLIDEWDSDF